jgi:predicted  nucleic acid-binding Zn-ribbon protein
MNEQEMAVKLAEVDARSKSNTHRLDDVEEKVDTLQRLTTAVEVMATEQRHQTETMGEIKNDVTALGKKVDAIEKKPGKRWDGMVDKFLYGLVGALATALAGGLFYLLTVAA